MAIFRLPFRCSAVIKADSSAVQVVPLMDSSGMDVSFAEQVKADASSIQASIKKNLMLNSSVEVRSGEHSVVYICKYGGLFSYVLWLIYGN